MPIHLITGDDESLVRSAVTDLVHALVGDGDRSMMVDEFDGPDYEVRSVVDAASTPPFLTDKRVIVARDVGRFADADVAALIDYVGNPLDTSDVVLVAGGGRLSKKLSDAVKKAGSVVSAAAPQRAKERTPWLADKVSAAEVKLDPPALARLGDWLGEDVGRLDGILATLRSTYGTGSRLGVSEIEPFLGEAGGVPPWDLTDAIDNGKTTAALTVLARMTGAGGRHPLQIMSILHAHYANMAKLDGLDARTEADAMEATGIKSSFPARKALDNYRRLGGSGVKRAIELLAQADLDLRGARDLPDDVVMDVLVARLSKLRR